MKKIIAILLAMIMLLALVACENEGVEVVTKKAGSITKKYENNSTSNAGNGTATKAPELTTEATPPKTDESSVPPKTDAPIVTESVITTTGEKSATDVEEPTKYGYYRIQDNGEDWAIDHSLSLLSAGGNNSFIFRLYYKERLTEDECNQIGVDYDEFIILHSIYVVSGSYTMAGENVVIPEVKQVNFIQGCISADNVDYSTKLLDSYWVEYENGNLSDRMMEIYTIALGGEYVDVTNEFTPVIRSFTFNDEDNTFEYDADGIP